MGTRRRSLFQSNGVTAVWMSMRSIIRSIRLSPTFLRRGLPKWDVVKRADHILQDGFDAEDSELTRWASLYIILAVIQRAYSPGSLLREIPILLGAQGIGKSALIRNVFPPDLQRGFLQCQFQF